MSTGISGRPPAPQKWPLRTNISVVYQRQGNQVQTKEMATKAYHIYLNVLRPDHPSLNRDEKCQVHLLPCLSVYCE
jgi:hypothetical protein